MTRYDAYKLIHVAAAISWLGAGLLFNVLAVRAAGAADERLKTFFGEIGWLSKHLFIPASLTALVFGVLMVIDGPWSFDRLWIVLGLIGYFATFATGVGLIEPGGKRIAAAIERDGGVSPATVADIRRLLAIGRADLVVLYLTVAAMVLKPTGDDVGILLAMAVVLAGGVAASLARARGAEAATSS